MGKSVLVIQHHSNLNNVCQVPLFGYDKPYVVYCKIGSGSPQ